MIKNYLLFLLIIIVILIPIIILIFKNRERYQPFNKDILRYITFPMLNLDELKNFAQTSRKNKEIVQAYFDTFKIQTSLQELLNTHYFTTVQIPSLDTWKKVIKNSNPDLPEDILQNISQTYYDEINMGTNLSLLSITEIFKILEAKERNLILDAVEGLESEKVLMVTYPIIIGKIDTDKIIKAYQKNTLKDSLVYLEYPPFKHEIELSVFIKLENNTEKISNLDRIADTLYWIILPLAQHPNNPYKGLRVKKEEVYSEYLNRDVIGYLYHFNFSKIKYYSPEIGYIQFPSAFPKKRGLELPEVKEEDV